MNELFDNIKENEQYECPTFNVDPFKELTIMVFCPKCGEALKLKDFDDRTGDITERPDAWVDLSFEPCECEKNDKQQSNFKKRK